MEWPVGTYYYDCCTPGVLISQVKSSTVVGLRDRVAIIRALLHAISSPQPYAGYGDLIGVGRRRNLSEAACFRYRNKWCCSTVAR